MKNAKDIKVKNICRIITLYHDRCSFGDLDKSFYDNKSELYVNIGYYDWMKTSRKEFTKPYNLEEIYKSNLKVYKEVSKYQSYQNMYGFLSVPEAEAGRRSAVDEDIEFWYDSRTPLVFVTAIQFEKFNKEILSYFKKHIEDEYTGDKPKYIIYSTLDNYDLIVCSRSNSYYELICFINHLYHFGENEKLISYMYTNFSVSYPALNDSDLESLLSDDIIDSICIKAELNGESNLIINGELEGKLGYINELLSDALYPDKQETDHDYASYEILGDTDCRFIARNIKLYNIIKLYKDKDLLDRQNELFHSLFSSSTTSLNVKLHSGDLAQNVAKYKDHMENPSDAVKEDGIISDEAFLLLEQKLQQIENLVEEKDKAIYHQLHTIINYLSFINNLPYPRHQLLLYQYTETVISLLLKKLKSSGTKRISLREMYDYIEYIHSDIMENARTNIRNFQVSNYNVATYYAPARLRAFYLVVINWISDFYKCFSKEDAKLSYQFITIPSNKSITSVSQVWKNQFLEDKLMVAHISEKDFYNIKDLMLQEAHEAAHFVGNDEIRNREKRFHIITKYWIKKIHLLFCDKLKECSEENKHIIKHVDFSEFYSHADHIVKNLIAEIKKIESDAHAERTLYYSFYYKMYLQTIFSGTTLNRLLDYFIEKSALKTKAESDHVSFLRLKGALDEIDSLKKDIGNTLDLFVSEALMDKGGFNKNLFNLMKECYSDMSAILTLNVPAQDYFESVYQKLKSMKNYSDGSLFNRACIVMTAIAKQSNMPDMPFDQKSYLDILIEHDSEAEPDEPDKTKKLQLIRKRSKEMVEDSDQGAYYVLEYIGVCLDSFAALSRTIDNYGLEIRRDLARLYMDIQNSDFNDLIALIDSTIEKGIGKIRNKN